MKDRKTCQADETLSKARGGDPSAFAALVRSNQRLVYSLALRMLSDRHKAEDLAQDVFLQLHRNLSSIQSDEHLAFWLRRITSHRAIDRLRREPPIDFVTVDADAGPASDEGDADLLLQRQLRDLVARLAPAARAVVLLRYQDDLDPVEIARTLDMPVNTVKSHLKRSLATLREQVLGSRAGAAALTLRSPS